jgi:hypothetical protein
VPHPEASPADDESGDGDRNGEPQHARHHFNNARRGQQRNGGFAASRCVAHGVHVPSTGAAEAVFPLLRTRSRRVDRIEGGSGGQWTNVLLMTALASAHGGELPLV